MASSPRRTRVVPVAGSTPAVLETGEPQTATTGDTGGQVRRGSRPVKEYYIWDSEFRELKKTGAVAALLFAAGSGLIGFAVNVQVGLAFAENASEIIKGQWGTYRNVAIIAAAICYLFGMFQALDSYDQVERIKAETSHGTEKYVAKSRYRITFRVLVLLAALVLGAILGRALWL
jgi:hypothetical protein